MTIRTHTEIFKGEIVCCLDQKKINEKGNWWKTSLQSIIVEAGWWLCEIYHIFFRIFEIFHDKMLNVKLPVASHPTHRYSQSPNKALYDLASSSPYSSHIFFLEQLQTLSCCHSLYWAPSLSRYLQVSLFHFLRAFDQMSCL